MFQFHSFTSDWQVFPAKDFKKTVLFTIRRKRIKYLGMNLTKEVKDLYTRGILRFLFLQFFAAATQGIRDYKPLSITFGISVFHMKNTFIHSFCFSRWGWSSASSLLFLNFSPTIILTLLPTLWVKSTAFIMIVSLWKRYLVNVLLYKNVPPRCRLSCVFVFWVFVAVVKKCVHLLKIVYWAKD